MSELRRLALSVLLPGFVGTTVPDWLAGRIDEGLGGVCLFGQNIVGAEQVRDLTADLHRRRPGFLVASDEEGGTVTRLEADRGSSWPGHLTLGQLDDPGATFDVAAGLGAQARSAGIDLVLAPVLDVNSDPRNPVIGVRAFGDNPQLVSRHGVAFVQGLQSSGVAACGKHFPGHGATVTDSHVGLPVIDADAETVRQRDLPPFAAAVDAGVRCVMTAHVVLKALDHRPATTSPTVLRVLRDELGFTGVIVSDALDMGAVTLSGGRAAGAVAALRAGVDLLCVGNPRHPEPYDDEAAVEEIVQAVERAVVEGSLTRARVEEASDRVASLSDWVRSRPGLPSSSSDGLRDRGGRAAKQALRVRGDVGVRGEALVVMASAATGFAAGREDRSMLTALMRRRPSWECVGLERASDVASIVARAGEREVVVLVRERLSQPLSDAVGALLAARKDAVVIYTGLPDGDDRGHRTVHCFGGGRVTADAVADLIVEGAER